MSKQKVREPEQFRSVLWPESRVFQHCLLVTAPEQVFQQVAGEPDLLRPVQLFPELRPVSAFHLQEEAVWRLLLRFLSACQRNV